ncbi:hypothetical protein A2U01_0054047, partial [Trifolium medium]|nr:hypothetical protein [Trifolium medium]
VLCLSDKEEQFFTGSGSLEFVEERFDVEIQSAVGTKVPWLDNSLLSASSGARSFKLYNTSAGRQILGGGFET